ncbi:lantibiotic dehydratase [Glycomyces sp. L485]|uniref:lantibiotic dehydratase n=1 Tax=Glycomyces sp. L485 TaxID=2909235 RepID=UPI001F4A1095|nr:lantibiotic dehydratase [Glycomyces sp. L485]MCH7229969.1 lantibiotic dehydratase [Glycomyces sp. L485]
MFRAVEAGLVRLSVHTDARPRPALPVLHHTDPEAADAQREWIRATWADEALATAVEIASPALAGRIEAICAEKVADVRRIRRAASSLLRYRLRMDTRATPFGLFAGIAPIRFTDTPIVEIGTAHRATANLDATVLHQIVTSLERDLFSDLPVVVNNLAAIQGGRLTFLSQAELDGANPAEVSMRRTAALEAVLRLAEQPIQCADLAAKLAAEYPRTPAATIASLLQTLVARGALITSLRTPMTEPDPLGHVLTEVRVNTTATTRLDEDSVSLETLQQVHRELRTVEDIAGRRGSLADLRRMAEQLGAEANRPALAVDLRIDARLGMPPAVVAEAEDAASWLLRLTPLPEGFGVWVDYHHQFLERYGIGAVVRVRDLVDPVAGLGFPAGYRDSILTRAQPATTERDRQLLALAHRAVCQGRTEIDLEAENLTDLATADPVPPPHVGISFHLRAKDRHDLDAGRFTLVVEGAGRNVGTTEGRFLHLLDPEDRERITAAWAQLPTAFAGAQRLQLSGPPMYVSTANVGRVPQALPDLLALGEFPASGRETTRLDNLAVTADLDGLRLVNLVDGRAVEPVVPNAIEPTTRLHPLQRFLAELPRSRASVYAMPDWGIASALPVLPRLRAGRSILAAARWKISRAELPAKDRSWTEWTDAWEQLRRSHRIPDHAYLGDSDIRFRINLDDEAHLALLRDEIDRTGTAILREAPSDTDFDWIGGRAHEITLPLAARSLPNPAPKRIAPPATLTTAETDHLPGDGQWLYAKLYTHPGRFNDLLMLDVPELLTAWDEPPAWWFVRYRDPRPHLRLRVSLTETTGYGAASEHLGCWAAELRRRGLISQLQLDTYVPEIGRWGTGTALGAIEDVFTADSAAALAQLRHAARNPDPMQALCAASFIDLAIAFTGSVDEGMRWLLDHVARSGPPIDRPQVASLARLLDTESDVNASLSASSSGRAVLDAWQRRSATVTAYRLAINGSGNPDRNTVLASLMHLHHIRSATIDPAVEQDCLRLARTAALAWKARTPRSSHQ